MSVPEATANQETTGPGAALPGARSALVLLLTINLFNYIDRYILAAVLPRIETDLLPSDPLAKTKLGWLTTAFLLSYMVLAPIFGWLGDRMSRWLLVAVGVILWSLASGASGLAAAYALLLATRCLVGVGEAAYGPTAPTLISDFYPIKIRGWVLAWFYMAIPVGMALGYVLGGAMAGSWGWRWAFFLVVPPGLLLGLCCLGMREPQRGQAENSADQRRGQVHLRDYLVLARIPSYCLNTLGMTALTFAAGGIAVWIPTYIFEMEARFNLTPAVIKELEQASSPVPREVLDKLQPIFNHEFRSAKDFSRRLQELLTAAEWQGHRQVILNTVPDPSLGRINLIFGGIVVIAGLVGTLLGGLAGDWLRPRLAGAYFLVSGISMMLAFPLVLLFLVTPFPAAWLSVFGAVFCLSFNTGPTNTILANVTPPAIRSTAFALNIFIIHALGDAISPVVMGFIADHHSMGLAFGVVSVVILLGGIFWLWGTRYLQRDTEMATSRLS